MPLMTKAKYRELLEPQGELVPVLFIDHDNMIAHIHRNLGEKIMMVYEEACDLSGSMVRIIKDSNREYFRSNKVDDIPAFLKKENHAS